MTSEVDVINTFYRFGAALLIGVLVGLQRAYAHLQQEKEEKSFGGTRTFALLGLLGCTAAFLAADAGTPVTMQQVLRATRSEYAKLDRTVNESEIRGWQ